MPVIIDGTLGVNAAAVTTTSWNPTNLVIPGNSTIGDASSDTLTVNATPNFLTNVGIGTASPATKLHVIGNSGTGVVEARVASGGNAGDYGILSVAVSTSVKGRLVADANSGDFRIDTAGSSGNIAFLTGSSYTERLKIGADGRISVSTGGYLFLSPINGEGGELQFSNAAGTSNSLQIDVGPNDVARIIQNANQPMLFYTNGSEKVRIDAAGNLLIGTQSAQRASKLLIKSANVSQTSTLANFIISTTDTQATDVGGSLGLGGLVGGGDDTPFGYISGRKENSTSGNYAGYLAFATQDAGASVAERMRINSAGRVLVNSTLSWGKGIHVALANTRNSTLMNANNVNANLVLSAPFASPETTTNAGAKWGILFCGNGDLPQSITESSSTKSAGLFAVSEDTTAGYNRRVGIAFHTASADAAAAEKMRIDNDGNVLIGTQTQFGSSTVTVRTGGLANQGLALYSNSTTNGARLIFADNYYNAYIENVPTASASATALAFGTNGFERMRIDPYGVLTLSTGQIKFPASQNASSDPNTLDDYEEGTFTPVFAPSSGAFSSVSYATSHKGHYTKVGDLVSVYITLWVTGYSAGNGSGNITISLPFPVANLDQHYPVGTVAQYKEQGGFSPSLSGANIAARGNANSTLITLREDNNTSSIDVTVGQFSTSTSTFMRISLVYKTNT